MAAGCYGNKQLGPCKSSWLVEGGFRAKARWLLSAAVLSVLNQCKSWDLTSTDGSKQRFDSFGTMEGNQAHCLCLVALRHSSQGFVFTIKHIIMQSKSGYASVIKLHCLVLSSCLEPRLFNTTYWSLAVPSLLYHRLVDFLHCKSQHPAPSPAAATPCSASPQDRLKTCFWDGNNMSVLHQNISVEVPIWAYVRATYCTATQWPRRFSG